MMASFERKTGGRNNIVRVVDGDVFVADRNELDER
jgi:hypothetical protein